LIDGTSGHSAQTRDGRPVLFVVFGNQRTGSTLLASRLNSHPKICCHDEVFLPWAYSGPSLTKWLDAKNLPQLLKVVPGIRLSFLRWLSDADHASGDITAIGFKLMYNQMSLWPKLAYLMPAASFALRDPALRGWMQQNQVLVIHTLRKNHLKTLISHDLATQSGHFHSRDANVGDRRILVSVQWLKARLRRIELAEKAARNSIAGLPSVEIWYESYIGTGAAEYDARICNALGEQVPVGGLNSPLSKVSSDNLRDVIINYDEVVEDLCGTRFEHFLDLSGKLEEHSQYG
jgi:LPS sulfotransferase NodH